MAQFTDIPQAIKKVGPFTFLRHLWREMNEDHIFVYASALAYSWLLAVFPMFLFLLTLVGTLPAQDAKESVANIKVFLQTALPDKALDALWNSIEPQIQMAMESTSKGWVSFGLIVPLVLTLWAAAGGITATMAAMDKCYDVENTRGFLKQRPLAMALTALVCALSCIVLALWPIGTVIRSWIINQDVPYIEQGLVLGFDISRNILGGMAAMLILSVLYHFGPNVKHRFVVFSPGAVFTAFCWVALALGFRYYLSLVGDGSYSKFYGSLAGVAILLLLFYLYAVILLIGAEINAEIDFAMTGIPRGQRDLRSAQNALKKNRRATSIAGSVNAPVTTEMTEKATVVKSEEERPTPSPTNQT